jgi:hypothetical protein
MPELWDKELQVEITGLTSHSYKIQRHLSILFNTEHVMQLTKIVYENKPQCV